MNPKNTDRQPSSYHRITLAHALRAPAGSLADAVTASIPQVLLAVEDVTEGRGRVEIVALNYRAAPNADRTSVGRIEEDGSAVSFFHSVTNGKLWWHIHYRLKILTGIGSYEELQRSLERACPQQSGKMGAVSAAFAALEGGEKSAGPLISALVLEAPKKASSPTGRHRTPTKKAAAKGKKEPMPKAGAGAGASDGSPEKGKKKPARRVASGPMPIDLGEDETLALFASYCRDAGLPKGEWVAGATCVEAIKLAIADAADVADVPDDWVTVCRNRLAGSDLLMMRKPTPDGEIFFQLVLEGEEEAPFCPPNQTENGNGSGTSGGGVAPEESLPDAFPPEPGPQEDSPPEPEPEAFAPPEVDETPAPDSRAETIRALREADGEVQRLSRELSAALLRQSNLVASL